MVTAYISAGDSTDVVLPPPLEACVMLVEQSEGFLVNCSGANDGEVVAQVEAPLLCPDETRYVQVGSDFYCIPLVADG